MDPVDINPAETKYIVFRAWPGAPEGWMPLAMEGRWMDRPTAFAPKVGLRDLDTAPRAIAEATDRVEYREDGQAAQVYEVRPCQP